MSENKYMLFREDVFVGVFEGTHIFADQEVEIVGGPSSGSVKGVERSAAETQKFLEESFSADIHEEFLVIGHGVRHTVKAYPIFPPDCSWKLKS